MITVISGELTAYDASDRSCTPHIYHAGETFTDVGCGDVHLIRNEAAYAVVIAVQIVPAGQPRRIDADHPAIAQCLLARNRSFSERPIVKGKQSSFQNQYGDLNMPTAIQPQQKDNNFTANKSG